MPWSSATTLKLPSACTVLVVRPVNRLQSQFAPTNEIDRVPGTIHWLQAICMTAIALSELHASARVPFLVRWLR